MMKKCASCSLEKSFIEFSKNSRKKDGLQTFCKICCKQLNAKHYQVSKKKYKESAKKFKEKVYKFLVEYKTGKQCIDCKQIYPHYVMDFDHLKEKEFQISRAVGSKSMNSMKNEISKCELICSNCHRIRTWKRKEQSKIRR